MKYSTKLSLLFGLAFLAALNCEAGGKKDEYKTDPATGVRYILIKHNKSGAKPTMGEVAFITLAYKRDDDSLIFDSHAGGRSDSNSMIPISLQNNFRGSLEQGITLMSVGDSASFLISADSIYFKTFKAKRMPPYIKHGSNLKFYVKLVRVETIKQMEDNQRMVKAQREAELQKRQNDEAPSIKKYLADNNVTTRPMMIDSLYVLQRSGTPGMAINDGDSVEVKYTGMFLNGNVFEQSDKGDGSKGTIKLLYRSNGSFIRGWTEVLGMMHQGEKVRVLFPSSVAYGSNGTGKIIQPYTPLLFEIEVVKVTSPN